MRLSDLADAAVGLLGYGREGRSTHAALGRLGARHPPVVLDDAPRPADVALAWHRGDAALDALGRLDVLVVSAGVPPRHPVLRQVGALGLPVTTATNLFLAECAAEDIPVVAVTGSKGKSTTSTLLAHALRRGGVPAALLGNIGTPSLDALPELLETRALVVHETSSYQAARLDRVTEVAVITELFPEHLDWHGSAVAYYDDKLRVASLQEQDALTVFNAASDELARRAPLGPGRHAPYGVEAGVDFAAGWFRRGGMPFASGDAMLLRGLHNRRNACAVFTVATHLGVSDEAVCEILATLPGLPHRLEDAGVHGGLRWINDSISTAPEAGAAALEAHAEDARGLIAGGHDRGYDFLPLARAVAGSGLVAVATLPPSGAVLAADLRRIGWRGVLLEAGDLEEAVSWMARQAPAGSTVLFSPSSPSYGAYRDFEERGESFLRLVRNL